METSSALVSDVVDVTEPYVNEYRAHERVTLRSVAVLLLELDPKQRVDVVRQVEIDPNRTPRVQRDRCFIEISEDAWRALVSEAAVDRIS